MVYEEKYVVSNDIPPLQAVGWEGIKTKFYLIKKMFSSTCCLCIMNTHCTVKLH